MKWWIFTLGTVGVIAMVGVAVLVLQPPSPQPTTSFTKNQNTKNALTNFATVNPPSETIAPVTLTFVGDVMLDRYVRTTIATHGSSWPFEKIKPELFGDLVIGNLEGPFTDNSSVATESHLVFTFDPANAPALTSAGFTDFSLANNHTLNFGPSGLASTRSVLEKNSLGSFGDPKNAAGFTLTKKIHDRTFTFIGYHGLVSGRDTIVQEVKIAKAAGSIVIVMAHWGNEYQATPSTKQISDAHALIDAGADLIIGAHPHVVQPLEEYRGKMILYSLGNFLFDQYFSAETLQGLLVRFTLDEQVLSIELLPVVTTNGQVTLAPASTHTSLLTELKKNSTVSDLQRNEIGTGRITLPLNL